ncbi:hypothetical protein ILUMI_26111 [Ignelater luminosus]|uniref:Uncharacterized protein n=1 Tax=Ignelater luminosus TaxID=2038154 RepID=A0A8K0C940_IGNLU|nr:hypothetical protein ILUMI_26111 [Ignelater luminosus]
MEPEKLLYECKFCHLQTFNNDEIIIHIDNEHKTEVGSRQFLEVEGDPPIEVDDNENLPEEETIAVGGEKM